MLKILASKIIYLLVNKNFRRCLTQKLKKPWMKTFMDWSFTLHRSISGYLTWIGRSRHRRCSIKKGVLGNFAKFTGKHLCQRLFFNKVTGLRPATLLKKSLWNTCFPVNFTKFLRTPFLQNSSGRLLLDWVSQWLIFENLQNHQFFIHRFILMFY